MLDPSRDPVPYLQATTARGLEIAWVSDTHMHADFVSGSRERAEQGSTVLAPREAGLAFPHCPLEDGEDIDLGGLTMLALATPEHTPEHVSYLLLDGREPVGVFTGGACCHDGSLAPTSSRPSKRSRLRGRCIGRSGIGSRPCPMRRRSIRRTGPARSARRRRVRIASRRSRERDTNSLLASPGEDSFVRQLIGSSGTYPTYFARLREVNRCGPAV